MTRPQLHIRKNRPDPTKPWWIKVICNGAVRALQSAHSGTEALARGLVELEHHHCASCAR